VDTFVGTVKARAASRTLILGASPLAAELIAAIRGHAVSGYDVVGVVGERGEHAGPPLPAPLLGFMDDLPRLLSQTAAKRIVVALAEWRGHLPVQQLLVARCRGVAVEDVEDAYERLTGKVAMESLTPSRVIFSEYFQPACLTVTLGRALSLLVASVGLVVLAPLLALIALAIKLDSPGPVLFVQERVGLCGRPFRLLKFRTMRPTPHARSEWARDNGDRVTRVGGLLRKFRLDELPQFVNILRGEMNLVGPRPHPRSNYEMFALVSRNAPQWGGQIPYYSLRSMVRPGITGWAQVRYRYANDLVEEMEKMRYDLYYVKHLSVWLDLRILAETVKVIALGRCSEGEPRGLQATRPS
jgi:exopolysaccharide biosynthesis polyprenyl glycosylphosphotransferase